MTSIIFERQLGLLRSDVFARLEAAELLHSIQAAPGLHLKRQRDGETDGWKKNVVHDAGCNALAIERNDGRLMVSGGADPSIYLWDLEQKVSSESETTVQAIGAVKRDKDAHTHGITALSWYPFDSQAFMSSSFDHDLKLFSTETLKPSASFALPARITHHSISPIASHLLVACATSYPAARLIDLRSGDMAHSLAGHEGAVLSTMWSPIDENVLLTGGIDGTVRFWDVRRSHSGGFAQLDMNVTSGPLENRPRAKAHASAVNGITWTDDGKYIITSGHDDKIRVWDAASGANTLANFGPIIHTSRLVAMQPLIVPTRITGPRKRMMFFPNQREVLQFDLLEGTLLKKLKPARRPGEGQDPGKAYQHFNMALAWRPDSVELYSAHADGTIQVWTPPEEADEVIEAEVDESRKRKREALDELYRNLSGKKITFN